MIFEANFLSLNQIFLILFDAFVDIYKNLP